MNGSKPYWLGDGRVPHSKRTSCGEERFDFHLNRLLSISMAFFHICRRKFKTGKDVRSKPDGSEAVVSQNGWPIGVFGVRRFRHNPEALVRMVNEGDDFTLGRAYRPGAPQEIECEVMIETPLEIEGQMKVEQR